MHTEHNVWLNALDVIYHEALQRGSVKQFLTVLEGPQNEPKLMPAGNKTNAITTDTDTALSALQQKPNQSCNSQEKLALGCGASLRCKDILDEDPSAGLKTCLLKIKEKQTLKVDKKEKTLGVGLEPLSKKIREHYEQESTQHNKLNSCCRLIGEQAISLARFSFRLMDSFETEGETVAQKCKRMIISKMCLILRDMGSIFNKMQVTQAELTTLKELGHQYYNLHVLFLGRESLTNSVWTVGHVIPYFAQQLYDKYKVGYGILSMQGKESINAGVKESLAHSNRSCVEEGQNKWRQVFISDYVRNFYIPEFEPQPDRYKSHFISRIPDFCSSESHCECGRKYSNDDDNSSNICPICDDEFMTYIVDSIRQGEIHEALLEILLPHNCINCGTRFTTTAILNEHMIRCSSNTDDDTPNGSNKPKDFSVLSVKELKAELSFRRIKCPVRPKKNDLVTLLEQYEANRC